MRKLNPYRCFELLFRTAVLFCSAVLLSGTPATSQSTQRQLHRFDFEQIEMGVQFRISLYACDSEVANHAARAAFDRIRDLNSKLSDYDAQSEVRQLCEKPPAVWYPVSRDLHRVLLHARRLSTRTDGAFDVTAGHYTKLWRRARRRNQLPAAADLKSIAGVTGYRFMQVDPRQLRVRLMIAGMRIDLGGIAKGYAADQALHVLARSGIDRALVNGSGDIAVGKPPPGRTGWRIEIQALRNSPNTDPVSLKLVDCAVATSGDAFQHLDIAGQRFSHIIDARTGQALTTSSSVTVIASSGMSADSLASSVSVLGVAAGIRTIENLPHAEAYIVTVRKGKVSAAHSSGFGALRSGSEDRVPPESVR